MQPSRPHDGRPVVTVVVVGAGLGGLRVCESLRRRGYDGAVTMVGDESHAPYSRPPLSKEALRRFGPQLARLRTDDELHALDVDVRLGVSARRVDAAAHHVQLSDGNEISYDELVLATGAKARTLPGAPTDRVFTLRTLDDSEALRPYLLAGGAVVIIGAGFIGLEVAASARALDCQVTVVDVLAAPLERVLDLSIGGAVQNLHESNGVVFRLGVGVGQIESTASGCRVVLTDGSVLPASVVVVGIGVTPSTDWLADSGLEVQDGIVCSPALMAAPGVWAVGDVTRWVPPGRMQSVRLEHWTNAIEQAEHVAGNIADGIITPFETVPYVWSDQYDAKLQSLGFTTKGDETKVVAGSFEEPKWTALVRSGDYLGGVVGMRSARQVMSARKLLAAGTRWDDAVEAHS